MLNNSKYTLPLPCNAPGTVINPRWEREHNVPRWFGWLINHLLAQIPLRQATTAGMPHRDTAALQAAMLGNLSTSQTVRKDTFSEIERYLPSWLLGEFLFSAITTTSPRHPHTDVPKLLRQTMHYHDAQSLNEEIPSRKWKELRELIKEEMLLLEPDRKLKLPEVQAMEVRSNLHCLQYALRAAYCIADEKSPITMAKCTSNAVQAFEAHTQKLNDTAYLIIVGYLVQQLGGTMPFQTPTV